MCSSVLSQTVEYYLNGGSRVYGLFLDASKAFDRVKHSKLFERLIKSGLCPLYVRFLYTMYKLNNASIEWSKKVSESISMSNRLKQGSILSPFLFSLNVDPLLNEINRSKIGCHVGDMSCNAFGYADDIALLSPTKQGLNNLIRICEKYSKDYSINFNSTKSQIVIFSNCTNNNSNDLGIKINGQSINTYNETKHLG